MASAPARGDDWIAIGEAARIMQCSKSWVLILVRRGDLVGEKIHSRAWLVSRKSATKNAEEYQSNAAKGRVGRPRAENPPAPSGLHLGGYVGSSRGNNQMVARTTNAAALDCNGLIVQTSDLVSVLTASRVSGFNRAWIYKLIERGDLWSVAIDGNVFVRKTDAKKLVRGKPGRPKRATEAAK